MAQNRVPRDLYFETYELRASPLLSKYSKRFNFWLREDGAHRQRKYEAAALKPRFKIIVLKKSVGRQFKYEAPEISMKVLAFPGQNFHVNFLGQNF